MQNWDNFLKGKIDRTRTITSLICIWLIKHKRDYFNKKCTIVFQKQKNVPYNAEEKIENVFFFIRLKWTDSAERSSLMELVSEVTLSWILWS